MQLQCYPFHSVKGRVLFLHWFNFVRKFWVGWLLFCNNFFFVTNRIVFFISLYLSAYLCETAWCHFLDVSTFIAISAQKRDTVPTELIPSNCWDKLIHMCTYTLLDCTCIGQFPKKSSSDSVQEAAVKDPGMNERVPEELTWPLVVYPAFLFLCIAVKYFIMWEKQPCRRERSNENTLCMGSGTAALQASGDPETRCSEIPGTGAQPLCKENNFFAIHVRLCVVLLVYLGCTMKWAEKPLCVCEFRIPSGLWQQCQNKGLKDSGKGPLPSLHLIAHYLLQPKLQHRPQEWPWITMTPEQVSCSQYCSS